MPMLQDQNEKGPSAPLKQNHEALSMSQDDGMESFVHGESPPAWTIGEKGGTEHRHGLEGSKEMDERRATPQMKTGGEDQTKDDGHGQTTGPSVEDTRQTEGESAIGVIQVAGKLKQTAIAVGGQQMEVWTEFWNETATLCHDMGKLEEQIWKAEGGRAGGEKTAGDGFQCQEMVQPMSRVQNLEKVALKLPTGSKIDIRVVAALNKAKEEMAGNNVKIVAKEARDEGKVVCGELKGDIQQAAAATKEGMKDMKGQMRLEMESKSAEQRKKAEACTAKSTWRGKTKNWGVKNRDLEHRVDRMAQERRQEEEVQVERMSKRAREVTGYDMNQKRMGEEDTVYNSRSGKIYAESVHDMGSRGND
ncbi:hypothetical protein F5876DRAFT_66584 [Lentinula aff. lateritia]|uniref:Uncharacterized protein n=1 Tax=Lentinula aff. lateritia TaxID=2804960 RepID=A0ACC1TXP3_9AGAR|nr:hypothetical protein F5876DRAFT_66584 [Lentinula aff. lateritia]